jgi:hypothetical protein
VPNISLGFKLFISHQNRHAGIDRLAYFGIDPDAMTLKNFHCVADNPRNLQPTCVAEK